MELHRQANSSRPSSLSSDIMSISIPTIPPSSGAGHNFCIVRAAEKPIMAHRSGLDLVLALDQGTVDLHKAKMNEGGTIIFRFLTGEWQPGSAWIFLQY